MSFAPTGLGSTWYFVFYRHFAPNGALIITLTLTLMFHDSRFTLTIHAHDSRSRFTYSLLSTFYYLLSNFLILLIYLTLLIHLLPHDHDNRDAQKEKRPQLIRLYRIIQRQDKHIADKR